MSKRAIFVAGLWVLTVSICAGETKPENPAPVKPPTETVPAKAAGRDWPGLFKNLQNAAPAVRDAAVTDFLSALEETAQKSKKPYFAKLKENFASKDLTIHDDAAKKVALVGQLVVMNDRRFKPLLAGLASPDTKARDEQLEFLFKSLEDSLVTDHVRDLIEQLSADDAATVEKAYEELKTFGADAADELANELDNDKLPVKKKCADLLMAMGPGAKEAVNSLIFTLRGDDKIARKYAAQILENLGPDAVEAVDDLVLNLDDEDKALRRICATILKKMGKAYKDATPELIVYLTHDDKTVRNLASELLIALGTEAKTGVQDLIDVIDEPPLPPAPNAPTQANNPNAQNAAAGNDIDSKIRAAKVLANIGPEAKEALPGLVKFANDKDPDLKDAVKLALDKITEGKPIETLLPKPEKTPAKPKDDKAADKSRTPGENF